MMVTKERLQIVLYVKWKKVQAPSCVLARKFTTVNERDSTHAQHPQTQGGLVVLSRVKTVLVPYWWAPGNAQIMHGFLSWGILRIWRGG